MTIRRYRSSFLVCTALFMTGCLGLGTLGAADKNPDSAYLFSYFIDNGQDGLRLAWSQDGLSWQALKDGKSFLKPQVGKERLMRDPCVISGPDGLFHMVWTDSWHGQTIGYASSKDLITWSEQKDIPLLVGEKGVGNCWAPEIIFDKKRQEYRIFWASTIAGRFPETVLGGKNDGNHRIYSITTKDFSTFTPAQLYFDPGFNTIDSTVMPLGNTFCMFFKDETKAPRAIKNLRLATASDLAGPFTVDPDPITPPGSWLEGPTAIRIGDYTYLYADSYTKHHYVALRSRDHKTWEDLTAQLVMPKGIRHGTAFAVTRPVLQRLLEQDKAAAIEATQRK